MTLKRVASLLALAGMIPAPLAAIAHGISDADKQRMLNGGYLQYVGLGATHMTTGYDHLLFLFGVVFFLTTFRDIAKFVTAFTPGHCITLIFATFLQITWIYFFVDALIEPPLANRCRYPILASCEVDHQVHQLATSLYAGTGLCQLCWPVGQLATWSKRPLAQERKTA